MRDLTWTSTGDPAPESLEELRSRLAAHNVAASGIGDSVDLAVFLHDEVGDLAGGATGYLWGAVLEVDFLWVRADLRGGGIGSEILSRLEEHAGLRGARVSFWNTCSFQAPEFYGRQGYQVTDVIEGYPDGVQKVFLKKTLA